MISAFVGRFNTTVNNKNASIGNTTLTTQDSNLIVKMKCKIILLLLL